MIPLLSTYEVGSWRGQQGKPYTGAPSAGRWWQGGQGSVLAQLPHTAPLLPVVPPRSQGPKTVSRPLTCHRPRSLPGSVAHRQGCVCCGLRVAHELCLACCCPLPCCLNTQQPSHPQLGRHSALGDTARIQSPPELRGGRGVTQAV